MLSPGWLVRVRAAGRDPVAGGAQAGVHELVQVEGREPGGGLVEEAGARSAPTVASDSRQSRPPLPSVVSGQRRSLPTPGKNPWSPMQRLEGESTARADRIDFADPRQIRLPVLVIGGSTHRSGGRGC